MALLRLCAGAFLAATVGAALPLMPRVADAQDGSGFEPYSLSQYVLQPVSVIEREDIDLSGIRSVVDLMGSKPAYNAFGLYRPFVAGSSDVAILVNGRRISDSAENFDHVVDLDAIPVSALERIEILSDSVVARYGGDAVGGAINIVLKRDFEGVEVETAAARPGEAGGDLEHASVVHGGALGEGRFTIGLDRFQRQEVRDADRAYSAADWTPGGAFAGTQGISVGGNTAFIVRSGSGAASAHALGTCSGNGYTGVLQRPYGVSGQGCGFAYADTKWHSGRLERTSLSVTADHPLNEDADFYGDVRIAQIDTMFRYAPPVGRLDFVVGSNPGQLGFGSQLADTLATLSNTRFSTGDAVSVFHRFVGHGNRDWRHEIGQYDATLGLRGGKGGAIGYDALLGYHRTDAEQLSDTFVSESAALSEVLAGRYDVVNPLSTAPAHLAAIRNMGLTLRRDRAEEHSVARVILDGDAAVLANEGLRWKAGTEVSRFDWKDVYDYRNSSGRSVAARDALGSAGNSAIGERSRWSAFAELSVPVTADWDFILSGRHDDYDDVGETLSRQIASRYRIDDALSLRASWSRGAGPPSLAAMHLQPTFDYPTICESGRGCYQAERSSIGNPALEAEKTRSLNAGAEIRWGPLSLNADWFRVEVEDAPAALSPQTIVDMDGTGQLPAGAGVQRTGGVVTRINSPFLNSGESETEGVNTHIALRGDVGEVDAGLDVYWLRETKSEARVAGNEVHVDSPRDRIHVTLRGTRSAITANWNIYALSGYSNKAETGRYKGWMGHDVVLRWHGALGLERLDILGGVLNVTDQGPSLDPGYRGISAVHGVGADVRQDSMLGRTVFVGMKVAFDS